MKISEIAELMVATGTLLTGIASVIMAIKKSQKNARQVKQSGSSKAQVVGAKALRPTMIISYREKK